MLEELDYEQEATNQAEFVTRYTDHPTIRIPTVLPELSTRRVLTQELVDGMRWGAAIQASQEDPRSLGSCDRSVLLPLAPHPRLVQGRPHPGNYLFHEDGTVTFLDFGCVKRFAGDALRHALDASGFIGLSSKVDNQRLLEWYSVLMEPVLAPQPYRFTPEFAAREVATTYDLYGEWGDVIREFRIEPT